jgi:2-hydroxychromene-2-carboxylate isomerase
MEKPSRPAVTFYFDFISPYAYLAWTQIHRLAERNGRAVEPVPVLFAALLDANGQKGPAEIERKRAYIFKDVVRSAHTLGEPIAPPATHPFNPLLALRITTVDLPETGRRALIDAVFRATWAESVNVSDPERMTEVLAGAGLDGKALVDWATTPTAKDRVRANTALALDAGAFGVPTMLVDGELFWGLDSFAHVETRLRGNDPVDAALLHEWARVVPSARRPGA